MSSRPSAFSSIDQLDQLRHVEAELALFATALRPATESCRRQLDAHARRRHDAQLVCHLQQHIELRELLEHDEHAMPELLADQRQPHELVVLVAVADDQVVGLVGERDDRLQLRLRSAFEAHAIRLAEFVNFLDDVPLLVDLDRKHGRVLARVAVLLDRRLELFAQLVHARAQQIRESQQHRHRDTLRFQILRQLEEIDFPIGVVAIRAHDDMPLGIDVEIPAAPPFDVVEGARVIDGPGHGSARGGFRRKREGSHGAVF